MNKAWFAPKRYGYGSGFPISWEGWVVLAGFFGGTWGLLTFAHAFLPPAVAAPVTFSGVVVLVAALVLIARAKTEGGWRWRNGKD